MSLLGSIVLVEYENLCHLLPLVCPDGLLGLFGGRLLLIGFVPFTAWISNPEAEDE